MDIYFITDNRPKNDLYELLHALLDQGLQMVQLRNKGKSIPEIKETITHILPLFESYKAQLIINDHLSIAHHFGIGVHLGLSDGDPIHARDVLGPEAIIGITVHEDLKRIHTYKDIATYVGSGPVFPTSTKLDTKSVIGVPRLKEVIMNSPLPVVAIGGINKHNAKQLMSPSPAYIAVCSAVCAAENPIEEFISLQTCINTP